MVVCRLWVCIFTGMRLRFAFELRLIRLEMSLISNANVAHETGVRCYLRCLKFIRISH